MNSSAVDDLVHSLTELAGSLHWLTVMVWVLIGAMVIKMVAGIIESDKAKKKDDKTPDERRRDEDTP